MWFGFILINFMMVKNINNFNIEVNEKRVKYYIFREFFGFVLIFLEF